MKIYNCFSWRKRRYFGQKDHVRIYGSEDYRNRLENAGFKIELYDIEKDLSIKEIKRLDLNQEEILYVCQKP